MREMKSDISSDVYGKIFAKIDEQTDLLDKDLASSPHLNMVDDNLISDTNKKPDGRYGESIEDIDDEKMDWTMLDQSKEGNNDEKMQELEDEDHNRVKSGMVEFDFSADPETAGTDLERSPSPCPMELEPDCDKGFEMECNSSMSGTEELKETESRMDIDFESRCYWEGQYG